MCIISGQWTLCCVTPGPEASQALPVTKTKTIKMQKAGRTNHKLESMPHNQKPERDVTCLPVMQKILKSRCFLKGQRADAYTSKEKQCTHQCRSDMSYHPSGDAHSVDRALSPSGFWPGGHQPWAQREKAETPEDPLQRRGKGPSSGRAVWRTRLSSTVTYLHLAVLRLGDYSTEILVQFFKDVFWRLLIRALMK